jgi:heat shock protein HtpX
MRSMQRDEVAGVLAHEITHIENGDMVTMTLVQGVVNAFSIFFSRVIANIIRSLVDERISHLVFFVSTIVFDIVFSMLGMVVVAWFSRAREFRADAGGAALAGRGNMIAALQRLAQNQALVDQSQPQLATMKISGGKPRGFRALISTHPPLEDRIAALQRG